MPGDSPMERRSRVDLLIDEQTPRLFDYFRSRARSAQDIMDLMQETVMRVLRQPDHAVDDEVKWLFGIARNVLLEHWGRCDKDKQRNVKLDDDSAYMDLSSPMNLTAPERRAHIEWRARIVLRAIEAARLSPTELQAFLLFHIEGFSYEEIAGRFGITVNQVKKALRKANPRLRDWLLRLTDRDIR